MSVGVRPWMCAVSIGTILLLLAATAVPVEARGPWERLKAIAGAPKPGGQKPGLAPPDQAAPAPQEKSKTTAPAIR